MQLHYIAKQGYYIFSRATKILKLVALLATNDLPLIFNPEVFILSLVFVAANTFNNYIYITIRVERCNGGILTGQCTILDIIPCVAEGFSPGKSRVLFEMILFSCKAQITFLAAFFYL